MFEWPVETRGDAVHFPQPPKQFGLIKCDLRSGLEALLYDVTIQTWFPGRARLRAEVAIVGHALHEAPDRRFPEASLQVSQAHRLFGVAPVGTVTTPETMPPTGKVQLAVEFDHDANRTYYGDELEMRCRYRWSHSAFDYYQFRIRTAPVIELTSTSPLTPAEWLSQHVLPLRELVTLATLERQQVAWLTVDEELPLSSDGTNPVAHQVFHADVAQEPYEAEQNTETDGATLFRFPNLPYSPVQLLSRWEEIRRSHRGFVQPMTQALTAQMDARARFLSLVQALEGLHTQTVGEGATSVAEHKARRRAVLTAVKEVGLAKEDVKWLNRWLDRYGRYSLDERLRQLRDAVREDVKDVCDLTLVPGDLAQVRNNLSHGNKDYPLEVLRPRMQAMSAIATAHLLRLLELPADRLHRLFAV